ncbi:hypothetical protein DR95_397 [Proteus vulgaris]|uniref:hypothetical protein n=1 Tax=Proteus vulgaris TaxID=585 RepID=UPI0005084F66|nr:hypothetical protein [Proteus vulgaris]KGA59205.1 hypothetical protein DR95_397 [Proteus vulgaris]
MGRAAPKTASSKALDIMNQAISDHRVLTEIDNARLMKLFDSMRRDGVSKVEFDTLSACYYALNADINNLIISAGSVLDAVISGYEDFNYFADNSFTALNNSLMIREVYKYMKLYNLPLSSMSEDIAELFMTTSILMNDHLSYNEIKSGLDHDSASDKVKMMDQLQSFLLRNQKISSDLSSYICDVFSIVSKDVSRKAIIEYLLPMISNYKIALHNDDGYEFIDISFIFPKNTDFDAVFELEDDMLQIISKLDYSPEVKTKISFNFVIIDDGLSDDH